MNNKVSLWLEDAMAFTSLLIAAAICSFPLGLATKPALVAPAVPVAIEAPLLLPLQCTARVRQSGANELPRARLLYAAELNDARCYKPRDL
jgi:hypothetical protein